MVKFLTNLTNLTNLVISNQQCSPYVATEINDIVIDIDNKFTISIFLDLNEFSTCSASYI